eukprot:UN03255
MEAESQTFELPYEQLPLRVANLKVEGISHTSPDIPLGLKETFNRVHSFQDLNAAFFTLERYLLSTKLYKDVKFAVMPPAVERPGDVDVHMVLTEYNSFSATIGMDQPVGAPLPVATGSVKFSNLIRGFGEYAQATLSRDPSGALSAVELAVRDVYPTLDTLLNTMHNFNIPFLVVKLYVVYLNKSLLLHLAVNDLMGNMHLIIL